ncbi:glycosyltransferase [Cellulomonas sp. PS-H5]|uniref:glycosyltransferase n=1 Tax=Cellulomonas sp. PS-H5 TaxID=2820400 RepID=UPI001C4F766B|nr:glycosyltransferase [Cellulomonas sp. PS-H5]MBW0252674.1 glycosyltransferase [Cellulomonas sp. PS-H5]
MTAAPAPGAAPRPVRVVVLDHTAQLGGAELALLRTVRALDPAAVEVTVVLFADGPLAGRLRDAGVAVRVLPLDSRIAQTDRAAAGRSALGAARSAAATLPFVARLARLLRDLQPDVVHTTSLKADVLGLPAARLARRPLVWHVHDRIAEDYLPAPVARVLRVLARRGPRHVVVNSHATARTLLPLPRGWTLAYPGLAPEQVAADPAARPAPATPVIGLVGRVSPTKGQREFVAAAALLTERFPDARFRVVGAALFEEQAYEVELRAQVAALGLTDRVELTGWVADPVGEIDRLSVLVHASPVPEPFGQVVVEGMARGVPVIATAGGGIDEIAVAADGTPRCLVVPPRDVPALAEAVAQVLDRPEEAAARADRAWKDVQADYAVARTAERLTAVWRRVARPARG